MAIGPANMSIFGPSITVDSRGHSLSLFIFIFAFLFPATTIYMVHSSKMIETPHTLRLYALNRSQKANTRESELDIGPSQNLYGLVIGIDNYPALPSLRGAVADANAMAEFLKSDLDVPAAHIVTLRDNQATRSRIIREFQALWENKNIQRDDPIVIYYAGHGGLAKANQEWKERYGTQQIQVIFPYDYQREIPGPSDSVKVNCIPDRTIASLLNKLAAEKGDNITVIFDSCHSASGTRDAAITKRDQRRRSAEVVLDIPLDIDDEFLASNGITSFPGKQSRDAQLLLHTDQSSHVHFAACGIHQKAIEQDGRGIFTTELLKKIRESQVDNITYRNLLKNLEISEYQSPQCYGKHKDRILFNARISSRNIAYIPVLLKNGTWTLEAGAASGVTQESIWELHEAPTENSESVGQFKVADLYDSIATLELDSGGESPMSGNNDHRLYARNVRIGRGDDLILKVWASHDAQQLLFSSPNQYPGRIHESGVGYTMTPTRDIADVVLEVHYPQPNKGSSTAIKPEVVFSWYDAVTKRYSATKLGNRTPASRDAVEVVLFAAARWRWHLLRANSLGKSLHQGVTMNMLKVANRLGVRSMPLKEPENVAANSDGIIEFVVDSTALYGFKLKSNISSPLYVRMFYFDTTDFSIGDMFGHNTARGESTFNVAPGGELLIGDGIDGGCPIRFSISSGNRVEIGYMKVFWSTAPLELDHIKQKSAFKLKPGDMRGGCIDCSGPTIEWGVVSLPLVLQEQV